MPGDTAKLEEALAAAEGAAAKAAAGVARQERELKAVDEQIATAKREIAGYDELDKVQHQDVVAAENAKRRLRKVRQLRAAIEGELEQARGAHEEAVRSTASAARNLHHQRVKNHAVDVLVAFRDEILPRIRETLSGHRALIEEAKTAGAVIESFWADADPSDPWTTIGEVLRAAAKAEFDASPAEVERRAREAQQAHGCDEKRRRRVETSARRQRDYGTIAVVEDADDPVELARQEAERKDREERARVNREAREREIERLESSDDPEDQERAARMRAEPEGEGFSEEGFRWKGRTRG